jgi:ectoine hydroxylase-related dioxygenase (phytanoyl-CoA dioxygenase family)
MSMHGETVIKLERDGYVIIADCIESEAIDALRAELEGTHADGVVKQRSGRAYGIRNLLNVMPSAREMANSAPLRSLVEAALGREARVVRGIYFDKHRDANWKVAWHQDLTIAVRRKVEAAGYGPWSLKAGIAHVQPPVDILENMLALRLHLDDTCEANGALRVIPGSHKHGRLDVRDIQHLKNEHGVTTCPVKKGGVMLMRPLLLHASSSATLPRRRRVLHFEYASASLPEGMDWYES